MLARLPVLVDQPEPGIAIAQLLDGPSHQAIGVSIEQALRMLKRRLTKEIKRHKVSSLSTWKDASLFQRNFTVQPSVFHRERRYPAGPKVALPVRYIELLDHRDQLYVMLPDYGDILYVPERKLLKTILSENVRSQTSSLSPGEIRRLWPAESSEIRWVRLKLAEPTRFRPSAQTKILSTVAEPLTDRRNLTVVAGSRDHALGLLRDTIPKGSCLVVGETGVGKSTLIAVTAREMQVERRRQQKSARDRTDGSLPSLPIFWQSSGGRLIAGMRYLGQWQQRLESVVAELADIDGVLVIENLLDLVSVGGSEPRDSLAAFLLPYLKSGSLRMVAEATPTELDACQRLLPALADVMPAVVVPPMKSEHEVELLNTSLANRLQSTNIDYDNEIPACLSRLCRQFQRHSSPPGPAMRFLEDMTGRRRSKEVPDVWTVPWFLKNFSKRTGLPLSLLDDSQTLDRDDVSRTLSKEVIGQERACSQIASVVTRIKSAVQDPKRPFGCILFCGPTGVGKTQLAKSLATYLFGAAGEKAPMTRLDMSEYSGPSAGFRLLNDADGNSAPWIQQIRSRPLSVVLLDEIEKASPEVFDILLSVLDEGRLTDRLGRVTSFRNSVILMTSNLGATSSTAVGFGDEKRIDYTNEVRKAFKPEFFNRLDRVIAFSPLSSSVVRQIIEKELGDLRSREGLQRYGRQIRWTDAVVERLSRLGVQAKLGARPLQQTIEADVVAPLSKWLVENSPTEAVDLLLDWNSEANSLSVAAEVVE